MLLHPKGKNKIFLSIIFGILLIIGLGIYFASSNLFNAPQKQSEQERLIIQIGKDDSKEVEDSLYEKGFIKNRLGFKIAFYGILNVNSRCIDCIMPGAYKISKSMSVFEIVKILKSDPYMKWVIIPEGYRKEQIADIFVEEFGWGDAQANEFIKRTNEVASIKEGIFFPDTYLIPLDESPTDVVDRLYARFNEKFNPYSKEAVSQDIKWTTLIKIASFVQREAGGKEDMPVIAGVLWNRLLQDMKLDIDATLQYVKGEKGDWWPVAKSIDKKIDSPYNTYMYEGLPPQPISNPGTSAIEAVLYPKKTDCLYYLHDSNRQIHCAETYEEHKENIEKFLSN